MTSPSDGPQAQLSGNEEMDTHELGFHWRPADLAVFVNPIKSDTKLALSRLSCSRRYFRPYSWILVDPGERTTVKSCKTPPLKL